MKHTKLQMLLRGQNVLGYKNYADDVVDAFVERSLATASTSSASSTRSTTCATSRGPSGRPRSWAAHAQGCIVFTIAPTYTIDKYRGHARELEQMGVDSIAIKDMAGLLTPYATYDLVAALKKMTNLPHPDPQPLHDRRWLDSRTSRGSRRAPTSSTVPSPRLQTQRRSHVPRPWWPRSNGTPYDTGIDLEALNSRGTVLHPGPREGAGSRVCWTPR